MVTRKQGSITAMLPEASFSQSPCPRSVGDRSRPRSVRPAESTVANSHVRSTVRATARDPRSRPIRAPECKRRWQHPCPGHSRPTQRVWQCLVAFRQCPSRLGPRRAVSVVRIASRGPNICWGPAADPPAGARERALAGGTRSCSFALRASSESTPSVPSCARMGQP